MSGEDAALLEAGAVWRTGPVGRVRAQASACWKTPIASSTSARVQPSSLDERLMSMRESCSPTCSLEALGFGPACCSWSTVGGGGCRVCDSRRPALKGWMIQPADAEASSPSTSRASARPTSRLSFATMGAGPADGLGRSATLLRAATEKRTDRRRRGAACAASPSGELGPSEMAGSGAEPVCCRSRDGSFVGCRSRVGGGSMGAVGCGALWGAIRASLASTSPMSGSSSGEANVERSVTSTSRTTSARSQPATEREVP